MTYTAAHLAALGREADAYVDQDAVVSLRKWRRQAEAKERARPPAVDRLTSTLSDHQLCSLAGQRAEVMRVELAAIMAADSLAGLAGEWAPVPLRAWLSSRVVTLGGRPLAEFNERTEQTEQLAGMLARVVCPLWWRRQMRRACVLLREAEGRARGEVRRGRQVYCTDDTVTRRAASNARNAEMLAASKIEDEAGQVITLALAVSKSVSNKAIRRHELMTRIRGCEEWAAAAGMVGLFSTNTTPSRFHPQRWLGGANPNHTTATPRDAQAWLCATWARCRAALARQGVPVFGFRVAEPHHDSTPHWHMLLWTAPQHLAALRETMTAAWLSEDLAAGRLALLAGGAEGPPNPDTLEAGAGLYRCHFKAIDGRGACSYVAKYISKNIDDVGALEAEGHKDDQAGVQADLFGGSARRVEAWAAAHSIRQFQSIGQPPVTIWRELRRITPESVAGASEAVQAAHQAAHRDGLRKASWAGYLVAQGGAMTGRDYRVRLVADLVTIDGRYGRAEVAKPIGVEDSRRPGAVVLSERREWRAAGAWPLKRDAARKPELFAALAATAGPAAREVLPLLGTLPVPWTRLNNCTPAAGQASRWRLAGDLPHMKPAPGGAIHHHQRASP